MLILYYKLALKLDKQVFKKALLYFFVPMLLLFILYFVQLHLVFGSLIAHMDTYTINEPLSNSLGKPAKYLFRILFLGRFFPGSTRNSVYEFCDSGTGILLFYSFIGIALGYIIMRFKRMSANAKAASFLFIYALFTLIIVIPLWFQDLFIVVNDRHPYITYAFLSMLIALLFNSMPGRYIGLSLLGIYIMINLRFTIQENRYWMKSSRIVSKLLNTFPDQGNKVALLLDLPQNMQGVPMISAMDEGEFKIMLQQFVAGRNYDNKEILDVASFNTLTPQDGSHVTVLNDSMLRITANQWGTWWWHNGRGCINYENEYYKLSVSDAHFYDLTLKKDLGIYLLLFQTAGNWKIADWNKKNIDQY